MVVVVHLVQQFSTFNVMEVSLSLSLSLSLCLFCHDLSIAIHYTSSILLGRPRPRPAFALAELPKGTLAAHVAGGLDPSDAAWPG